MEKSDLVSARVEAAQDIFMERHSCCIGCPYNKASEASKDGVKVFNCTADPDKFSCSYIPELYPHKLAKYEKGLPDADAKDESSLGLYEILLVDTVTEGLSTVLTVGNSSKQVRDVMERRLENPAWSHVVVKRVRQMKDIHGYNIIIAPPDVTKLYYPGIVVDIDRREKVNLEPIQIEVIRYVSKNEEHDETNHKLRILGGVYGAQVVDKGGDEET